MLLQKGDSETATKLLWAELTEHSSIELDIGEVLSLNVTHRSVGSKERGEQSENRNVLLTLKARKDWGDERGNEKINCYLRTWTLRLTWGTLEVA